MAGNTRDAIRQWLVQMPFSNPIVLITRPDPGAGEFLTALSAASTGAFQPILSPAFGYIETAFDPVAQPHDAVFTSRQAVRAVRANGRRAWCVGDRTATVAREAGFDVMNAGGAAEDLIGLIRQEHPRHLLVHYRGEVSRGDVAKNLRDTGLQCDERVVYRKQVLPLTEEASIALGGKEPVLLPLFSPETAHILSLSGPFVAPLHVVAMSSAVSEACQALDPETLRTVDKPRMADMVEHVAALIA